MLCAATEPFAKAARGAGEIYALFLDEEAPLEVSAIMEGAVSLISQAVRVQA